MAILRPKVRPRFIIAPHIAINRMEICRRYRSWSFLSPFVGSNKTTRRCDQGVVVSGVGGSLNFVLRATIILLFIILRGRPRFHENSRSSFHYVPRRGHTTSFMSVSRRMQTRTRIHHQREDDALMHFKAAYEFPKSPVCHREVEPRKRESTLIPDHSFFASL